VEGAHEVKLAIGGDAGLKQQKLSTEDQKTMKSYQAGPRTGNKKGAGIGDILEEVS
jgi:hypothetical protein